MKITLIVGKNPSTRPNPSLFQSFQEKLQLQYFPRKARSIYLIIALISIFFRFSTTYPPNSLSFPPLLSADFKTYNLSISQNNRKFLPIQLLAFNIFEGRLYVENWLKVRSKTFAKAVQFSDYFFATGQIDRTIGGWLLLLSTQLRFFNLQGWIIQSLLEGQIFDISFILCQNTRNLLTTNFLLHSLSITLHFPSMIQYQYSKALIILIMERHWRSIDESFAKMSQASLRSPFLDLQCKHSSLR